jgi:hypothetical protein
VFGLLGISDGVDMHEFIETAGGNKKAMNQQTRQVLG